MTYLTRTDTLFSTSLNIPFFPVSRLLEIRSRNYKVLWPEWWNQGREIEQMKYVIAFLRDFCNCDIYFCSQFQPSRATGRYFDFAIMSGVVGAQLGVDWASAIFRDSSINLFISETEGIYRISDVEEFVWGHLKDTKYALWSLCSKWSDGSLRLTIDNYPFLKKTCFVSGSLAIDRHVLWIQDSATKDFIKETPKHTFGIALDDYMNSYQAILHTYGKSVASTYLDKHRLSSDTIYDFILSHPDNSFCLKPHPADIDSDPHPLISTCSKLHNVTVLNKDYSLDSAMSSSISWIVQRSTSCVEALARQMPVFRVGELDPPFEQFELLPSLQDITSETQYLDYSSYIASFPACLNILEIVYAVDGCNHLRFCNALFNYLSENAATNIPTRLRFPPAFLLRKTVFYQIFSLLHTLQILLPSIIRRRYDRSAVEYLNRTIDEAGIQLLSLYKSH